MSHRTYRAGLTWRGPGGAGQLTVQLDVPLRRPSVPTRELDSCRICGCSDFDGGNCQVCGAPRMAFVLEGRRS